MTLQQPTARGAIANRWKTIWKNKRLLGAITGALLIGIGGVAYLNTRSQKQKIAQQEAAKPLPIQVKVTALGRVEPAGGVINVAASEQGVVKELLVEEGDKVTQGQPVAYLDLYDVRLAERNYAESQLAEAEDALAAKIQLDQARIQEADSRIAQVDLPEAESIRSQRAAIGDLQAQLNLARTDLRRFETLANQGAIAQQQLDSKAAEVAQIEQKIAAAQATLEQLSAARSANLDNASAQMSAAEANLSVSQATAGVKSAERNLALAEAKLEQTLVRAPINGQVIDIFVEAGESASGQSGPQAILSVGKTQTMQVIAEVYETDVGRVKLGQSATIRSRNGAFDETLTGTVEEIALQIFKNDILDDDPAANADARVVEVTITVDQPEVIRQLTNLQVDVEIDVDGPRKVSPENGTRPAEPANPGESTP